ncbi:citrate/2-methylcitrate synthase [Acidaminobacter hydrogenoformans]|uniref:citrate synthase (unknown stereospecificity) n=1 Tax=Acidaminobacter hydrogenoformans DSM 2784 TaxID=1120920 RepID=A0A1G5RW20_9FIRM|nr:citrate/2-methylcitrate synthase [Acidaminobacter hydrogenoformans]SCZ77930.1 citrate synthase [Acidaminobacter hydrogenoformans DSM 2784]
MCLANDYTEYFGHLAEMAYNNNVTDCEVYEKYEVKRGLRNANGTGVLVGVTRIADVYGYRLENGVKIPDEGRLSYRGIDICDLVEGFQQEKRRGFEESVFLLLFGKLPTQSELADFNGLLDDFRALPPGYTESMILKIPSKDIMNKLMRSVLVLYSHDDDPDNTSVENVLRQSIQMIARFPTIISYGYQAKAHYIDGKSLFIHAPRRGVGTAENVLHMIRSDNRYSRTEAETLDLLLTLHADHGGGNNSAFATHVVSSTGTDTYSALATAVGSLKGPKHGGANKMVIDMVADIKANVEDWSDTHQLKAYLHKIITKQAFDKQGLIYGMGHAVYTLSDPRAVLLKKKAFELALEKNAMKEYELFSNIEALTKELFLELKGPNAVISANVDLYSGFVYEMLDIPADLYTPLFAVARVAGWCAHRIEQIVSDTKIIRPAYKNILDPQDYVKLKNR